MCTFLKSNPAGLCVFLRLAPAKVIGKGCPQAPDLANLEPYNKNSNNNPNNHNHGNNSNNNNNNNHSNNNNFGRALTMASLFLQERQHLRTDLVLRATGSSSSAKQHSFARPSAGAHCPSVSDDEIIVRTLVSATLSLMGALGPQPLCWYVHRPCIRFARQAAEQESVELNILSVPSVNSEPTL